MSVLGGLRILKKFRSPLQPLLNVPPLLKPKVGDETKKGIEENREILKQMKKPATFTEFTKND